MNLKIEKKQDVVVLQVKGSLDADSVSQFKKKVNKIIEEGSKCLVLDGSELEFVDSMGLGSLISLLRKLRSQNGDLKVAAISKEVQQVFEITRLHQLFQIFSNSDEAIKAF